MTKTLTSFLRVSAIITLVVQLSSCSAGCDDCQEMTTKNVVYIDLLGNNLFFGDSAIFNPDSVYIQVNNSAPEPAGQNLKKGAFHFS